MPCRWATESPARAPLGRESEYYASSRSTRASLSQLQALVRPKSTDPALQHVNVQTGRCKHTKRKLQIGKRAYGRVAAVQAKRAVPRGKTALFLQKRGLPTRRRLRSAASSESRRRGRGTDRLLSAVLVAWRDLFRGSPVRGAAGSCRCAPRDNPPSV